MTSLSLTLGRYVAAAALVVAAGAATTVLPVPTFARGADQAQAPKVFRSGLNLVSVDVIVRDKTGAVVRGLTAADFEVREDGRPQEISSFTFEEVSSKPVPAVESAGLLAGVEDKIKEDPRRPSAPPTRRLEESDGPARHLPARRPRGPDRGRGRIDRRHDG